MKQGKQGHRGGSRHAKGADIGAKGTLSGGQGRLAVKNDGSSFKAGTVPTSNAVAQKIAKITGGGSKKFGPAK
jgi:hypothetical protein